MYEFLNLKVVIRYTFRNYKEKRKVYSTTIISKKKKKTNYWNTFTLKFHVCSSLG